MGVKWIKSLVIGAGVLVITTPALADKAADAVDYRQGIMTAIGWNIGPMGAMVKGKIPFDATRFAFLAGRSAMLAPMASEGFSVDSKQAKSHAKATLWDNKEDFDKRMKEFVGATTKLAEVAKSGDEAAMKKEFGNTVHSCKGCHDKYQVKD